MIRPVSASDPRTVDRRTVSQVRWSWSDLAFSLSDKKLVVARRSRAELAHLTVGWGNQSGLIDVHLTFGHEAAMASDQPKDHEPLFVVSTATLNVAGDVIETFVQREVRPFVSQSFQRYRPGWLARRGYVILLAGKDDFRRLVERVAPKQRRKHRVDLRELVNPATHATVLGDNIYSPEILVCPESGAEFESDPELKMPVSAIRFHRGAPVPGDTILLRYGHDSKGVLGWCGIMNRHVAAFSARLSLVLVKWVAAHVGVPHIEMLDRVVAAMALNELDDLRPVLARARDFLQDPRYPIPAPAGSSRTTSSHEA